MAQMPSAPLDSPPPLPANLAAPQASIGGLAGQGGMPSAVETKKPVIERLATIDSMMQEVGSMEPKLSSIMQSMRDMLRQQAAGALFNQQAGDGQTQAAAPGVGGLVVSGAAPPGMMS